MNRFSRKTFPPASHSNVLFRKRLMKSTKAGDSNVRDSVQRFGRFPASFDWPSSSGVGFFVVDGMSRRSARQQGVNRARRAFCPTGREIRFKRAVESGMLLLFNEQKKR
jgi:hypothetical protein|tara:strand:+ start:5644 stop:5970 length:327 start_codon:yes stop_codon:yes gene_type:complete